MSEAKFTQAMVAHETALIHKAPDASQMTFTRILP
jgi:hypothetical protein